MQSSRSGRFAGSESSGSRDAGWGSPLHRERGRPTTWRVLHWFSESAPFHLVVISTYDLERVLVFCSTTGWCPKPTPRARSPPGWRRHPRRFPWLGRGRRACRSHLQACSLPDGRSRPWGQCLCGSVPAQERSSTHASHTQHAEATTSFVPRRSSRMVNAPRPRRPSARRKCRNHQVFKVTQYKAARPRLSRRASAGGSKQAGFGGRPNPSS